MRFDPFRELDRLANGNLATGTRPSMPMDAYRRGSQFVVHFDLPGVDPGSIDLTVEKNVLAITAERSFAKAEGDEVVVSERPQGRFTRQLFLGESLDPDSIRADFDRGVLTLHIPVAEKARPRKVAVSTGGSATEISA